MRAKEDSDPEPSAGPGANWAYIAIPTAAAMIIMIAFWLFPSSANLDTSQLYADNFSPAISKRWIYIFLAKNCPQPYINERCRRAKFANFLYASL